MRAWNKSNIPKIRSLEEVAMSNPPSRRTSTSSSSTNHHYQLPISDSPFQSQNPTTTTTARIATLVNSLKFFLKKPHSFPFLLSIFLLLTWVSLRFQRHSRNSSSFSSSSSSMGSSFSTNRQLHGGEMNSAANLVRFYSLSSDIAKDKRGWLIDPVSLALQSGISGFLISFPLFQIVIIYLSY